jgi:hypothetical protein
VASRQQLQQQLPLPQPRLLTLCGLCSRQLLLLLLLPPPTLLLLLLPLRGLLTCC